MESALLAKDSALSMKWKWPLYLLAAFPIVDYFLHAGPWHLLGAVWAKLVLMYVAALAAGRHMEHGGYRKRSTHWLMLYMILLGIAYIAMDTQYVGVALAGYEIDFMYMLIAFLLPYVLSRDDLLPMLKLVVFTGFLMAMHGWYEYAIAAPIPAFWLNLGEHARTRVYSLFYSPNVMGSYMAFVAPLATGIAVYEKNRGQRLFYSLAAILAVGALVFTETRGAWLAFFVAVMVFFWLVDKRMILAVIALGILSYFFVHSIHARLQQFLSPVYWTKTVASGRIARWENAYNLMRANPLFGKGLGRYGGAVAARYFHTIYVDNNYVKILAEMGLLGLISYLVLVAAYLRDVLRVWKRAVDRRTKVLLAGVFSSLVVFTVHAFVENIFEVPAIAMLYWLVGILAIIYGEEDTAAN